MNPLFRLKKYCAYRLHARKGKYAHSPFVYQLSMAVFEKKSTLPNKNYGFDNDKYGQLMSKIAAYLNTENIQIMNIMPDSGRAYDYFDESAKYTDNNSVFIIKDLYRSSESAAVWEKIKAHPKTTVTFDLFHQGIVFFRRESSKENFIIKY